MILCGGAYNSPQLLMLSGVGAGRAPDDARRSRSLLDQPAVGENLSDHPAAYTVLTTPEPESLAARRWSRRRWRSSRPPRPGRFASNLAEAGGFARVGERRRRRRTSSSTSRPLQIVDEGTAPDPEAHGVWVSPCLLTPASRGSVGLASNDPTAKP